VRKHLFACLLALAVAGTALFGYQHRQFEKRSLCVSNLTQILLAKDAYAVEHDLPKGTAVTIAQLFPSQPTIELRCPCGGRYLINPIGQTPSCSYTRPVWYWRHWKEDGVFGRIVRYYHALPEEMK